MCADGARGARGGLAPPDDSPFSVALVLFAAICYIAISVALINFNKYLMTPERFPFSGGLGLLHSSMSFLLAALTFQIRPDLFPSLSDPNLKLPLTGSIIYKTALPIAACFALQIVLSNQAYLYADVAFLQMLKESNIVAVYALSVAFGIEVCTSRAFCLLVCIIFATWMTVKGELNFTLAGFVLQGTSFFAESLKITLQGLLLSSSGVKLDPLSYLLVVMPMCACMFACFLFFCGFCLPADQAVLPAPTLADWRDNWKVLLVNALVAFGLNLIGAFFVKVSSAVSYVLAGILKDTMIVVVGVLWMGHEMSMMQGCGFSLQVSLILVWSLIKTFPSQFEDGVFLGLRILLSKRPSEASSIDPVELSSLLKKVDLSGDEAT